jgi:hypothetical protein
LADRRLPGVELDGTIEIGKRSFETALLAEGYTPIGVGDGLLLAIELAPLNQIGAGDDGLIGRRIVQSFKSSALAVWAPNSSKVTARTARTAKARA